MQSALIFAVVFLRTCGLLGGRGLGKFVCYKQWRRPAGLGSRSHLCPRLGSVCRNVYTAIGHVITAVIGAGVLSLPYSMSMLGWVAGPMCLLLFAFITLYTSQLLAECYVIDGRRQRTYTDVVHTTFGDTGYVVLGVIQHSNLYLTALAYHITATISLQTVATQICSAHAVQNCFDSYWKWAIIFGAFQVVFVQMPDLNYYWWASLIGAAMSFSYSIIALGLSISKRSTHGTAGGQDLAPADKAFGVLNAIGSILFAYSFSMILIEIQDTLKPNDTEGVVRPMKVAVNFSVGAMTLFYLAVAIAGYMAFGNSVPNNILTGFANPLWLVAMANVMVVIHLIPAYQVYSQPFLSFVEFHYGKWKYAVLPGMPFRLFFRTAFVVSVAFLAICLPFFSDIIGFVGAIGFWPATVFFPIECWIRVYKPERAKLLWLRVLNVACLVVTVAATIGSIQQIVVDSGDYKIFSS